MNTGSVLLTTVFWQKTNASRLKSLIQRFATRERNCFAKAKPSFLWRNRRLAAVTVFRKRFGPVPEIFTRHKLPKQDSYYIKDGEYVWRLQKPSLPPS
ncbi:MAG TPA: hypothetical protein DCQ84_00640 [Candidatus Competibacteraceae bacterium]|nr:hypothetical protein [Candidatus Competibacteraceae bacterium]